MLLLSDSFVLIKIFKKKYFNAVSIILTWDRAVKVSHAVYDPYAL